MATLSFEANATRGPVRADRDRRDRRDRRVGPIRVTDVLVGLPLCVLAVPVVLALAALLVVVHGADPLFVHERIGWRGRRLRIPKLRTLAPWHDPYADKTAVAIEPRSRLTAFLRDRHLDELPQLFLIPMGRMSLVGPRPRMDAEATACRDPEFDELRTTVLPGCTGLWQISDAQRGRVSDRPEYDRLYVEQRTVRLDLWIVWRTIAQALGAAPIVIDDVPRWALRAPAHAETAR